MGACSKPKKGRIPGCPCIRSTGTGTKTSWDVLDVPETSYHPPPKKNILGMSPPNLGVSPAGNPTKTFNKMKNKKH